MAVGANIKAASRARRSPPLASDSSLQRHANPSPASTKVLPNGHAIIEHRRTPAADRTATIFRAALDGVSEAVALIDGDCKVLYANAPAREALSSGQGISLKPASRFFIEDEGSRALFMKALLRCDLLARRNGTGARDVAIRVAISCDRSFPLVITAQPIALQASTSDELVVALFIKDYRTTVNDGSEMLRQNYGLSTGESDLVVQLSLGFVLKEIASRRSVSYETVRSQLRRVMQKTGARRQADVIRLLGGEADKFRTS